MLAAFPAAQVQLTARLGVLSLGNNKGTHHEKSEDSGCARAARGGDGGERRGVIHLDSHERLRFPRLQSVGQGSGGSGEPRLCRGERLYLGAWASNVDFGDADVNYEVDVYTGFSGGSEKARLGRRRRLLRLSRRVRFRLYRSVWRHHLPVVRPSSGTRTTSAAIHRRRHVRDLCRGQCTLPLPANFSFLLHAGLSTGDYWDDIAGDDVIDYSAGVGYDVGNFSLGVEVRRHHRRGDHRRRLQQRRPRDLHDRDDLPLGREKGMKPSG